MRDAKQTVDSLAAINSSVSNQDFIDHVLLVLGKEYDTLVGIITHFPGQFLLEDLRSKSLLHEQRLQHFEGSDLPSLPQAFATQNTHSNSSSTTHSYHGGCGRGRTYSPRGRGCGSSGRFQQHQGSTTNNFPRNDSTGQITSGIDSAFHVSYGSQSANRCSPSSRVLDSHPSTLICQICGSIGHQALQCSIRFNHSFVANDLPKYFATMSVGETNDATWFLSRLPLLT